MNIMNTTRTLLRAGAVTGGVVVSSVFIVAGPASAEGSDRGERNTLTAQYADGTWTPEGLTVRIAPGEERLNGKRTDFIEASIDGTACIAPHDSDEDEDDRDGDRMSYLVTADLQAIESGDLRGIRVKARHGDADVKRNQAFTGTLTVQPSNADCSVPTDSPTVITDPTLRIDADWDKKRGARPVEYSGEDCGGTGSCYYVEATATGTISMPGERNATLDLGRTDSAFLFRGDYPL